MMKKLLFLLLISVSFPAFSQFRFENDSAFSYTDPAIVKSLGIKEPDFRRSSFELRIWSNDPLSGNKELILIRYGKNKVADVSYFAIPRHRPAVQKIVSANAAIRWNEFWENLRRNGFFQLQGEQATEPKSISYTFELLSPTAKRKYSYGCTSIQSDAGSIAFDNLRFIIYSLGLQSGICSE